VVPEAPPKYKTFEPGLICVSSTPPIIAAAYILISVSEYKSLTLALRPIRQW